MYPPFHVMVKPIGSVCNLDCTYCYYTPKSDLLGHAATDRLSDGLLEEFIRQYVTTQDADPYLQQIVARLHGSGATNVGVSSAASTRR